MDIKLYYTPKTRSVRPRWILEELELPYSLHHIDLFAGEGQSKEYKQINALGAVPALQIDDNLMLESGAMCHWLADFYADKGLAPELRDPARIKYEQWMTFSQATLEMQPWLIILHSKILPETSRVDDIVPWAKTRHENVLDVLNNELQHGGYLIGDDFTAADIMVGTTLMMLPELLTKYPMLENYVQQLKQRPAYQAAIN